MKKTLLIFSLLLFAISGCSSDPAKKLPKGIISQTKMKEIYIDVFLAEAAAQNEHQLNDSTKKLMQLRYQQIAMKHGIKTKDLFTNLQYYTRHPQLYTEVLQTVIDSLSSMEARIK